MTTDSIIQMAKEIALDSSAEYRAHRLAELSENPDFASESSKLSAKVAELVSEMESFDGYRLSLRDRMFTLAAIAGGARELKRICRVHGVTLDGALANASQAADVAAAQAVRAGLSKTKQKRAYVDAFKAAM